MKSKINPFRSTSIAALAAFTVFLTMGSAHAAARTWNNGAATGNWNTTDSNWTGSVWNNATPDDAIFGASGVGTVSLTSAITAGSITINNSGYTIDTATFGLTLNTGITANESATIQSGIGGSLILGANNLWTVADTKTLSASSAISGTGVNLTKEGTGTAVLNAANTYTSATTVNAGTLQLAYPGDSNGGVGTLAVGGSITVNSGGTLLGSVNNALGHSLTHVGDSLTINQGGTLNIAAGKVLTMAYALNVVGGTISSVDGGDSEYGSAYYGSTTGTFTSADDGTAATLSAQRFNLGNGVPFNVTDGSGAVDLNVTGTLIGGSFTKDGGGTMTLSGDNTFNGNIAITGGTLNADLTKGLAAPTSGALGNPTAAGRTVTISSDATLNFSQSDVLGNALNDPAISLIANGGTIKNSGAFFNKLGAVQLDGGTLSSTGGNSVNYPSFALGGTVTIGGSTVSTISTSGSDSHIGLMGAGTTFDVADAVAGSDLNVTGVLADWSYDYSGGPGSLIKTGGGTMALSNANTYTGATVVNTGTLQLAFTGDSNGGVGTLAVGSSITVNSGGTLLGSVNNALGHSATHVSDLLTINQGGELTVDAGKVLTMPYALNVVGGTISSVDGGDSEYGSIYYGAATGTFTSADDGTAATISAQRFNLGNVVPFNVTVGSGAVDLSVTGTLIGGAFVKNGDGTMVLSGANSYAGETTVSAGTLVLGGSGVIPNASPVSLGAATLDAATAGTETAGTLGVTAAATINLATDAQLVFTSGTATWAGSLDITGAFVSGLSLNFGSSSGLSATQLAAITLNGGGGPFTLNGSGFLVSGGDSAYALWQSANSTTQTADLDHDNDGVSNGVEHFLGGIANTTGNSNPLPSVTNTAGVLSVTWTKAAAFTGTYGTDFVVETSATLSGDWATESYPGGNVTITGITGNDVKYTFPAGTKNFARLKVIVAAP